MEVSRRVTSSASTSSEELGVSHAAGAGQGQALGQGVEAPAELDLSQQGLELRGDRSERAQSCRTAFGLETVL